MSVNIFDPKYYASANSDLGKAGLTTDSQLTSHFQQYGLQEGRSFSSLVDLGYYRACNQDLAKFDNKQLFNHLEKYGVAEGRKFSPFVDLGFYGKKNQDLAGFKNEQLFEHLSKYGLQEGREFSRVVDLSFYKAANQDLNKFNNIELFKHLQNYGIKENRLFSPYFNISYYQENNLDLVQAGLKDKQLLEHFVKYGSSEGRQFNPLFDVNYYRNQNPDLVKAGLNSQQLIEHFEDFGLKEGRFFSPNFNPTVYLGNNEDLIAAKFDNKQAYNHFQLYGRKEGRLGSDYAPLAFFGRFLPLNSQSQTGAIDFVGDSDIVDAYSITLDKMSNVTIKLDKLTANANLVLSEAINGGAADEFRTIASSNNPGTNPEEITFNYLSPGRYGIAVFQGEKGANTNYKLEVSVTEGKAADQIGNNLATAKDITNSLPTTSLRDYVDGVDIEDVYKFTLSNPGNINLNLGVTSNNNLNFQIIQDKNNDGNIDDIDILADSGSGDKALKEIKANGLLPGSYYIRVKNTTNTDNFYNLNVSTSPLPANPTAINGVKWNDANANGKRDDGELALPGWTIFLDQNKNGLLDKGEKSTITNAEGKYSFLALDAGTYNVASVPKEGWKDTYPSISMGDSVISVQNHRDLVYDKQRQTVYITTASGSIERYDMANHRLLTPLQIGKNLFGADITPDGNYLYVAEGDRSSKQGIIYKVNLMDKDNTVKNITYSPFFGEGGVLDINIAANGKAIFTTIDEGAGLTSVREINLSNDTVTIRTNINNGSSKYLTPTGNIYRGADRNLFLTVEGNNSGGFIFTYDAVADKSVHSGSINVPANSSRASVNRDSSLVAVEFNNDIAIYEDDLSYLRTLNNLDGGMVFDPVKDILYALSTTSDEIIALDTKTWKEVSRFGVGEDISSVNPGEASTAFGQGVMTVSDDGQFLFLSTQTGIRQFNLSAPKSHTVQLLDSATVSDINFGANAVSMLQTNKEMTVDEGGKIIISTDALQVKDIDGKANQLTYTLQKAPTNGTLKLKDASLALNQSFTQEDIDSKNLAYENNGSESPNDNFEFSVSDIAGNQINGTFKIAVKQVNDAPIISLNQEKKLIRGTTVTIDSTSLMAKDPENSTVTYTLNTTPTKGSLKLNDKTLIKGETFTQEDITANHLTYQHQADNTDKDSFNFEITDGIAKTSGSFNLAIRNTANPILVKDINKGLKSSSPYALGKANGKAYFGIDDGFNGRELWISDGTPSGTNLLKDIALNTNSSNPDNLTVVGKTIFFTATNSANGTELWKTDGTSAGTMLVKDIALGSTGSNPSNLINLNGTLYFTAASTPTAKELWKTDGTSEGTMKVQDIPSSFTPREFTVLGNSLFFTGGDSTKGTLLYKYDAQSGGITTVKEPAKPGANYLINSLTVVNDTLLFTTYDSVSGTELWKTNGNPADTMLVKDINPGALGSTPSQLINISNQVYFFALDSQNSYALWKTDGTTNGTTTVKQLKDKSLVGSSVCNVNGVLYFVISQGNSKELWKSNGSEMETMMVKNLGTSIPTDLTNVNGTLYFKFNDGVTGAELWQSDGTETGTTIVKDIAPGSSSSSPSNLINIDSKLLFTANDGVTGNELWTLY
jgi:ELWxxDGT repeat protein